MASFGIPFMQLLLSADMVRNVIPQVLPCVMDRNGVLCQSEPEAKRSQFGGRSFEHAFMLSIMAMAPWD